MPDEENEQGVDPAKIGLESSPEVTIPENSTESASPNNETESMEVHHHTHHGHGQKSWKSYVWEFLMLFLAVFCGFLAEYQLEHVIEHQREKEFVKSMVEDLSADTLSLNYTIAYYDKLMPQADSLIGFLKMEKSENENVRLYELSYNLVYRFTGFIYNNRTIQQLKNAGNFRLIRNKSVSNRILEYDNLNITALQGLGQRTIDAFNNFETTAATLIDLSEFQKSARVFMDSGYVPALRLSSNPLVFSTDKERVRALQSATFNLWVACGFYKNILHFAKLKNNELLAAIKKEYSIDE